MMRFFLMASGAALCASCASRAELEPAPAAHRIGERMAVDESGGVIVEAEVHAWPAGDRVAAYVTPVRVRVRNEGDRPIRIRYESFTMVGPRGEERPARAPYAVARERPTGPEQAVLPPFREEGWGKNPIYGEIHPDLETDRYRLGWSIDADRLYYPRLSGPRPTERMEELALEEVVLEPGEEAEGFLYFDRVEPAPGETFIFRYRVRDAPAGRRTGDIAIPFRREPPTGRRS